MKSYKELGFDEFITRNPLHKELEEDARRARKDDERQQHRRELLKIKRRASSGKEPLIYLIDRIIEKCLMSTTDTIELSIDYLDVADDIMHAIVPIHEFFLKLKNEGCFSKVERVSKTFVVTKPDLKKLKKYKVKLAKSIATTSDIPLIIAINHASLYKEKMLLEINHGEKNLSFYPRKISLNKGDGTKTFKILSVLWEKREEKKGKKTSRNGDFISATNLKRLSGCQNDDAVYQHIKRLNARFAKEGLKIKIVGRKNEFRIMIEMQ